MDIKTEMQITPDALEILKRARDIVTLGWTRGVGARNAYGRPVSSSDPTATCWCLIGATNTARHQLFPNPEQFVYAAEVHIHVNNWLRRYHAHLVTYNDAPERTQVEVLAFLDKAIDDAQKELQP